MFGVLTVLRGSVLRIPAFHRSRGPFATPPKALGPPALTREVSTVRGPEERPDTDGDTNRRPCFTVYLPCMQMTPRLEENERNPFGCRLRCRPRPVLDEASQVPIVAPSGPFPIQGPGFSSSGLHPIPAPARPARQRFATLQGPKTLKGGHSD